LKAENGKKGAPEAQEMEDGNGKRGIVTSF
jgi:hypothetical protein